MTLRFIGDASADKMLEVQRRIESVAANAFVLSIGGVGVIPGRGPPRVLFVQGHDPSGQLNHLQAQIESAIADVGYDAIDKDFLPHVTIARLNRAEPAVCKQWAARNSDYRCDGILVGSFALLKSTLGPAGAVYEEVQVYPLTVA